MTSVIGVDFKAGGKEYRLAMTTNAMANYEVAHGESVIAAFSRLEKEPSILLLRGLFWAALTPQIPEAEAGDLIDEIGLLEATELLGKASGNAFSDLDANPPKPLKKAS